MGSASSNSDAWSAVSIAPSIPMRPSSPGRDTTKWTRPQEMDGPNSTMMAPSTVRSASISPTNPPSKLENGDFFSNLLVLTFPVERASEHLDQLKTGLNNFIDLAVARVRRASGLEDHVPEAVAYVAKIVGRELPQPEPGTEPTDSEQIDNDGEDSGTSREPRVRGRTQIFER